MKKVFSKTFNIIILIMCIFAISNNTIYGVELSLSQIVTKFNASPYIAKYELSGIQVLAREENNSIIIKTIYSGETKEITYTWTNNILETIIDKNDVMGVIVSSLLINCMGQLQGYSAEYMSALMTLEETSNYTVDNQGVSLKILDNGNGELKINTKTMNFTTDISKIYFQVADLQDIKEYISGNGSAQKTKGYLTLNKGGYGNEVSFFIAQNNEITYITYESILSVLEVMFDSKDAPDYFKTIYPSISNGNYTSDAISVEINPEKTSLESAVIGSEPYKFVRVTINKSKFLSLASNGNSSQSTNNYGGMLPKTGNDNSVIDFLQMIVVISVITLFVFAIYNKTNERLKKN